MALLAVAGVSVSARAQGSAQEQSEANPGTTGSDTDTGAREWYGGPMVLTDLAASGLLVGGVAAADRKHSSLGGGLLAAGVAAYVLGGPVIHLSAGARGRVFASLGLRVGAPLVGALAGFVIGAVAYAGCKMDGCQLSYGAGGAAIGLAGGILVAAVVDNVFLARKPVPSKRLAFSVAPTYQPATGQTSISFYGAW